MKRAQLCSGRVNLPLGQTGESIWFHCFCVWPPGAMCSFLSSFITATSNFLAHAERCLMCRYREQGPMRFHCVLWAGLHNAMPPWGSQTFIQSPPLSHYLKTSKIFLPNKTSVQNFFYYLCWYIKLTTINTSRTFENGMFISKFFKGKEI